MTDYAAFVPVVNRPDLLKNLMAAVRPLWDSLTVIDNSPDHWVWEELRCKDDIPVDVFTPPVPLSFSQSMNWELTETLRWEKKYCIHMHSDAIIPAGACEKLLDFVRNLPPPPPKWGVTYTHYDVLCAYNPKVYEDIGGYDTSLPNYFGDNDYFHRMELAGWKRINSGIEVGHVGSQTINSDPYLKFLNSVTFPLYREYYRIKWGGAPGEERFIYPFGVRPREMQLA